MDNRFITYLYSRPSPDDVSKKARDFYDFMSRRRTIRHFSAEPVPVAVVKDLVKAASTAPSGAHRQPWSFVAVSDQALKHRIRLAAEHEERENYSRRMPDEWLEAVRPLGTNDCKPFLDEAPWLVVIFTQKFHLDSEARRVKHYYVSESVGIAAGIFLTAVHHAGLVALTHTPSPMGFLREILERPANETPFLLIPIGYPASGAKVPDLQRKPLSEVLWTVTAP